MDIKVRFSGATVKVLQQVRQSAFRAGDIRVIRRVTALLELREQTMTDVAEALGVSERTVSRWVQAFILEGVSGLW